MPDDSPLKDTATPRRALRLAAGLLLAGQLLYIVITLLHTGGDANDHASAFVAYAASASWKAVHVGQFVAMAILLAGLMALSSATDTSDGLARWGASSGALSAAVALVLYAVLQAVDGIALKEAADAWVRSPASEKAARFASAEAIRWLEWGTRSYHTFALGLALLLLAVAIARTSWIPRAIAPLMVLSGLAYLAQGWVVGDEGFSAIGSAAIVLAYVLDLAWMIWLAVVGWRMRGP